MLIPPLLLLPPIQRWDEYGYAAPVSGFRSGLRYQAYGCMWPVRVPLHEDRAKLTETGRVLHIGTRGVRSGSPGRPPAGRCCPKPRLDEASAGVDDARGLAEEIVERAKFQADTIRRVAIQDSAALQAKHTELLAAVEALERRASRLSGPPDQAKLSAGRHRRRPSSPSSVPKQRPAPPRAPTSGSTPTRETAEALVRQLELNLPKYMKELAQARKSRDLAKVRVAEGALERCRNSLVEARAAIDRERVAETGR